MRCLAAILAVLLAAPVFCDDVEDVRRSELAFARAFADRDREKFFSFVADDATFLSPVSTARGKAEVVKAWSRYFDLPQAPFSWMPDRVAITADGRAALSTGPVFTPDGRHGGDFLSTWRKQADGTWKVTFDSSGPGPALLPESAPKIEEGFVPLADGARLHYRRVGRGLVTLIVPLEFVMFDVVKQFSNMATVISYDLRNRGRSSRVEDASTLTIEQDVRDLEAVREHFKIEKFVPVGYSYLGKMVVMYAAAHPDRVGRVIQLGPAANSDTVTGTKRAVEDFGAPPEALQRWQKLRGEGAAEKSPKEFCLAQWEVFRYLMVGDPKNAARFPVQENCDLETEWPVNFNRHMTTLGPSVREAVLSPDELKRVSMPVLTIHGTKDRNAPYEAGVAWAAALPDARLVTLPGAAHAMWLDAPLETYAAIRTFLRGEWPMESAP